MPGSSLDSRNSVAKRTASSSSSHRLRPAFAVYAAGVCRPCARHLPTLSPAFAVSAPASCRLCARHWRLCARRLASLRSAFAISAPGVLPSLRQAFARNGIAPSYLAVLRSDYRPMRALLSSDHPTCLWAFTHSALNTRTLNYFQITSHSAAYFGMKISLITRLASVSAIVVRCQFGHVSATVSTAI